MKFIKPEIRFGASLESLLARRERLSKTEEYTSGKRIKILNLTAAIRSYIETGSEILEIDAGPGHFTRLLSMLDVGLTVLEPTSTFYHSLTELLSGRENTQVIQGFTEDLPKGKTYDTALVTFPARRGMGLLSLVNEIAPHVNKRILLIIPDDGSLDWAYLTRACAFEGFKAQVEFIIDEEQGHDGEHFPRAAALVVITKTKSFHDIRMQFSWDVTAREIEVPYPVPRGAATRLVRYFIAGGDRAVLIRTHPEGLNRLYGNLRTAAHRIAREEVTVRRVNEGIQLLLIPHVS